MSLLSCVDNYVDVCLVSLFTFLMFVCLVSLLFCVDNCVFLLCLVSLLMFLMSVCPVSLMSCVNNYVDFYVLCHSHC